MRSSHVLVVALGVACVLSMLALPLAAGAAGVGGDVQPGWIAYSEGNIYLVREDGTGRRQVSRGDDLDLGASWSPDGRWIAWGRTGDSPEMGNDPTEIWLARSDGSGQRRLVPRKLQPLGFAWSPDGSRIAFTGCPNRCEVYVIGRDGRGLRRVTAGYGPTWSPDGTKIAFAQDGKNLYVVNASGTGLRRLLHVNASQDAEVSGPSWSPDGKLVLYHRTTDTYTGHLALIDANGRHGRRLTRIPRDALEASWSPDGRRILFACSFGGATDVASASVFVINVDGTGFRRLVFISEMAGGSFFPAWSPDGKKIAFVGYPKADDSPGIFVMSSKGTAIHRITKYTDDDAPDWQPTGRTP